MYTMLGINCIYSELHGQIMFYNETYIQLNIASITYKTQILLLKKKFMVDNQSNIE